MLFKLSLKNIKKSVKDYVIYFLTLILGVAIFYVFNALDSQEAMLRVSSSTRSIMQLMVEMLSGVSVVVALILGFLIIYANNFLIKRRKKEFAIYMTLGMGRRDISKILLGETIVIGCVSLLVGLVIGIFASQFMSILVAKMFEADMTAFVFTFSRNALVKTVIYFGIMYVIVILFNTFTLSKYQLIDLFQAKKKMEKSGLKTSYLAVFIFWLAVLFLSYAYYSVTADFANLGSGKIPVMIAIGCVSTYFIFWSLSGFLLKLLQRIKGVYLKGLNAFVLRQLNSSINTSVFSMTVICLLFFVTICVLSAGLSVNNAMRSELTELTPADVNLYKPMDYPEEEYSREQIAVSQMTVKEVLEQGGIDMSMFRDDAVEITVYTCDTLTLESTVGAVKEEVMKQYPLVKWEAAEAIVSLSDYNKAAEIYGHPQLSLEAGKYIELCDYEEIVKFRNKALALGTKVVIGGMELEPQYAECVESFLYIAAIHCNDGIIIVPDEVIRQELGKTLSREENLFIADYNAETKEEKQALEDILLSTDFENKLRSQNIELDGQTKITIYESSTGLATIATFIAIYLGIVFLIAGAALLALKELSDSADNQERYRILNKIGADRKMQNHALLGQMGIFFGMPMVLACIHSVFGIQFAQNLLSVMYKKEDMIASIVITAGILLVIYGIYFLTTYFGCKKIIEE